MGQAASAAADYLATRQPTPDAVAQAMLHSYDTAFWWSAAFFAAGTVICGLSCPPASRPEIQPQNHREKGSAQ